MSSGVARLGCLGCSGGIPCAPAAAPYSPRPAIPGKANYISQQSSKRPLSFQVFARGRRSGRGLDVTLLHSLSLCQSRDHFFFLPLLPPPQPAPPSLFPFPPSLPSPLGLCAGAPDPLRSPDARNSRQESARWSLLPPFPFPAPFPHPRTWARSRGQRNPKVSIPPSAPFSHLSLPIDSGTRREGCVTCACLQTNPGKPTQTINPLPPPCARVSRASAPIHRPPPL